jgi:hypothetical protein
MASMSKGFVKLGHPLWDSYFKSASNKGASQQAQWYLPGSWLLQ